MSPKSKRRRRAVAIGSAGVLACVLTGVVATQWPGPPVERATIASLVLVPAWSGLALAAVAWQRRVRPGDARRSLVDLHRRLGGALAVLAMLIFGSGVAAVLDRASASWQAGVSADATIPAASEQALDAALAELLRQHPELGQADVALHPASDEHPWIEAEFFAGDRKLVRVDLDPETGRERARGRTPLWLLRELHRRLLVHPILGESLLGLLGLLLGLVLLSGIATRRWLRPRSSNPDRKRPPLTMRAHQWIGVSLLPIASLWAWTGALLGLTLVIVPVVGAAAYDGDRAALMRDVLAVDRPALDEHSVAAPPLRELVDRRCPALASLPDAEVERIFIHHPTRASATVRVDLEGAGLLARGSFTVGADAALRDCRSLRDAGFGLASFMAAIDLHYGDWEAPGLPRWLVDLAYVVLGSALVALAWLGGQLLARRRERERDLRGALRLRRSLASVGFGLAYATVGLALLSRFPNVARSELAAWITLAVIVAAVSAWFFTGELARRSRVAVIGLLLGLLAIPIAG